LGALARVGRGHRAGGRLVVAPGHDETTLDSAPPSARHRRRLRALPIFLAFFVMGLVDSVGVLVGYAREQFRLDATMAGLLPFFGFAAFALVSVPAGVLVARRGKQPVLVLGLGLVALGEILPVISVARYEYLLAAIFLIGVGMTVVQVAGNPIMRDV